MKRSILALAFMTCLPLPAYALRVPAAYHQVALEYDVPAGILFAIALAESGRAKLQPMSGRPPATYRPSSPSTGDMFPMRLLTLSLLGLGLRAWRRAALDIGSDDAPDRSVHTDAGAGPAPLPLTEDSDGAMTTPHPAGEDDDRPDERAEDA